MICDICSGNMAPDALPETYRCGSCGFFKSTFAVRINEIDRIDESIRESALKPVRMANFDQILRECRPFIPEGGDILDVGCAHGWFLSAAKAQGYRAVGIEPDRQMVERARAGGHDPFEGFFPQQLPPGARYDVITFNDVFEHLPDVEGMARAVRNHLKPGGIAIINIPVSDGSVFRASRLAAKCGFRGPLERMWQKGLPSPHLSYFSSATLTRLMTNVGFQAVTANDLVAIKLDGLYQRIRYDRAVSSPKAAAIFAAAFAMKAASSISPSDIRYFVFRAPA